MKSYMRSLMLVLTAFLLCVGQAAAQRRGGGGHMARGGARTSMTRPSADVSRPSGAGTRFDADRTNLTNIINPNINRPVTIDREVNINGHGGYYDDRDGCCDHPIAAAATVTTAAAVTSAAARTAAAVGSMVYALPPYCSSRIVGGVAYEQCGSTWYQPQFYGTDATYIVVAPPL